MIWSVKSTGVLWGKDNVADPASDGMIVQARMPGSCQECQIGGPRPKTKIFEVPYSGRRSPGTCYYVNNDDNHVVFCYPLLMLPTAVNLTFADFRRFSPPRHPILNMNQKDHHQMESKSSWLLAPRAMIFDNVNFDNSLQIPAIQDTCLPQKKAQHNVGMRILSI